MNSVHWAQYFLPHIWAFSPPAPSALNAFLSFNPLAKFLLSSKLTARCLSYFLDSPWLEFLFSYSTLEVLLSEDLSHCFLFVCFCFLRKADCYIQHIIWVCLESWKLDCSTFSYKWTLRACLKVLAREHSYSYTLDQRMVIFYQEMSSLTDHAALRRMYMEWWGRKGTPA